jgi:hypothetical protein
MRICKQFASGEALHAGARKQIHGCFDQCSCGSLNSAKQVNNTAKIKNESLQSKLPTIVGSVSKVPEQLDTVAVTIAEAFLKPMPRQPE